jgi:hypothetical protein
MQIYQMIPETLRVGLFGIQNENQWIDLTKSTSNTVQFTQSEYLSFG